MNRIILLLVFSSIVVMTIQAQCPNSGSARLESQEEVDEFVDRYPDCTELTSELRLGNNTFSSPSSDITDLSGLSNIRRIGRHLIIGHLDSLRNLNGLSSIEYIGLDLEINYNDNLIEFNALAELDSIGGDLRITQNPNLVNFNDLSNISYVGDDVEISKNEKLVSIEGLKGLSIVNGALKISESPQLESLRGLENVVSTNGRLEVSETGVENMSPLKSFTRADGEFGYVTISENLNLKSLSGLENLSHIETSLYIDDCPLLTSIEALGSLNYLGENFRIKNTGLTNMQGLENVQVGSGYISLSKNENLSSLDGINIKTNVSDYLFIQSNPQLSNISAVNTIDSIQNGLSLNWNPLLVDCEPICRLLNNGYIGGIINISSNGLNCSSEEEITNQICSSSNENLTLRNLSALPNPAAEYLLIEYSSSKIGDQEIIIINNLGAVVQLIRLNEKSTNRIDISGLDPGVYHITSKSNNLIPIRFVKL